MRNRVVLLLLSVFCAGVFSTAVQAAPMSGNMAQNSARVKVDQSSRRAVTRTFVLAILKQDVAVLEKIFSPGLKSMLMDQARSSGRQANDFQALLNMIMPSIRQGLMRQYKITDAEIALLDEKLINKMIDEASQQQGNMVREINGKWYITLGTKENSAPVEGSAVGGKGFASKRAVAEAMLWAVVESDPKAFWDLLAPEAQKSIDTMIQNNPKTPKRPEFMAMLIQAMRIELQKEFKLKSIKDVKNDPAIREKIINDLFSQPRAPFKKINGRWFMVLVM